MSVRGKLAAFVLAAIMLCVVAESASAQNRIPSVVQLPTFRFFSYQGTVVVPDRGAAYLGGSASSASGSIRRGPSRAIGQRQGLAQAAVHAQIIDLDAMDRQLLGASPEVIVGGEPSGVAGRAVDPNAEGKSLVRFARRRYQAGDQAAAFDAYWMAIEVLDGRLKKLASEEFRKRFGAAAEQALRRSSPATRYNRRR